jgi:hypothetical protein
MTTIDDQIYRIYDEAKFKTFEHVRKLVHEQLGDVDDRVIRKVYAEMRVKDPYPNRKKMIRLYVTIYSNAPNCWFHDLMENGSDPPYYHIFIGMNTRFGVAIQLPSKNSDSILKSLTRFVAKHNPVKLTSDEESAFMSERVLNYLRSENIIVQMMPSTVHSAMGMLNRFIRTLRDMHGMLTDDQDNVPSENITKDEMKALIKKYNNSEHSAIGVTPQERENNPEGV